MGTRKMMAQWKIPEELTAKDYLMPLGKGMIKFIINSVFHTLTTYISCP